MQDGNWAMVGFVIAQAGILTVVAMVREYFRIKTELQRLKEEVAALRLEFFHAPSTPPR